MKKIIVIIAILIAAINLSADFIAVNEMPTDLAKKRAIFFNKKMNSIKKLNEVSQLEEVNKLFNRFIKYNSDLNIYNKRNFIASIEETVLTLTGDCDDYAMAKFQALRYLGFSSTKMKLIYSVERGVKHIKLIVKVSSKYYVLDSYDKRFRKLRLKEVRQDLNRFRSASLFEKLVFYKKKSRNFSTLAALSNKINSRG